MEQIKSKLADKHINPREICDWDNGEEVEKMVIELK